MMAGAGTHLHRIIARRFGEDAISGCKCEKWIKKMDRLGVGWTRKHMPQLIQKMRNEAIDRGWRMARAPGARLGLRAIVELAIVRAEKDGG